MNWKQLLKRHLNETRNKSLPFMIVDNNKYHKFRDITESIKPFSCEDFLVLQSLQSQEKMIHYSNDKKLKYLNFDTPQESFILTLKEGESTKRIIVSRFCLINLSLEDTLSKQDCQVYNFQIIGPNSVYNSNLISPLDENTGNVKLTNHKGVDLRLTDNKGTKLTIQIEGNTLTVETNKKYKFVTGKPKKIKNLLTFHFENEYRDNHIFYLENMCTLEHVTHNYQNFILKRMIYNIVHSIIEEKIYKEIQLVLYFDKEDPICIDLKKCSFEDSIKNPLNNLSELSILTRDDYNIPLTWKVEYKNKIYYLKPQNSVLTSIPYKIEEKDYFTPLKIISRNDNSITGTGWVNYRGFEDNRKTTERKIKRLFQPLKRPNIEEFVNQKFPIEAVLPIIIIISLFIIFIFFIILIILIYTTTDLFTCTPETTRTPNSFISKTQKHLMNSSATEGHHL